jgi:hypothetical protein
MKVEDLRVGNRIIKDGVMILVDARTIFEFDTNTEIKYQGLPIKERFLTDNGFRGAGNGIYIKNGFCVTKMYRKKIYTFIGYVRGYRFKFVHELQNCYRFTTGKELIEI